MENNKKYEFLSKDTEEYCKKFPYVSQQEWTVFFALLYRLIEEDGLLSSEQYVTVSEVVDNLASFFCDGTYSGSTQGEPYWEMSLDSQDILERAFGVNIDRMYLPYTPLRIEKYFFGEIDYKKITGQELTRTEEELLWYGETFGRELFDACNTTPYPCKNDTGVIVYDVETTGLDQDKDEVLQVSVIDGDGNTLFNSYVRPYSHTSWEAAESVHGITPEMVSSAPYPHEIIPKLKGIFESAKNQVSYNGVFDRGFLERWDIDFTNTVQHDVMLEFAPVYGAWNEYRQDYKWQKLSKCAAYYGYEFKAHDSLEDVRATLYCWRKMHENDK